MIPFFKILQSLLFVVVLGLGVRRGEAFVGRGQPAACLYNMACCWSAKSSSSTSAAAAASETGATASSSPPPPSFDSDYYSPPDQSTLSSQKNGASSRITLTRFLSQYVKDHPEVRLLSKDSAVIINHKESINRIPVSLFGFVTMFLEYTLISFSFLDVHLAV